MAACDIAAFRAKGFLNKLPPQKPRTAFWPTSPSIGNIIGMITETTVKLATFSADSD
jgi:hypothetical protein